MKILNLQFTTLLSLTLVFAGCSSGEKSDDSAPKKSKVSQLHTKPMQPGKVPEEVSLRADREELAEARKDIPEDVRVQNDEAAVIAQLFTDDAEPMKIRDRFDKMIMKKREQMSESIRKRREAYSKNEKKERDIFLKKQGDQRQSYSRGKHKTEDTRQFYAEIDAERNEYFGTERDNRREFESQVEDQRKTFEDYVREKRGDFDDKLRNYRANFDERKKMELKKKEMQKKQMQIGPSGRPELGDQQVRSSGSGSGRFDASDGGSSVGSAGGANAAPAATPDPDLEAFRNSKGSPGTPLNTGSGKDGK